MPGRSQTLTLHSYPSLAAFCRTMRSTVGLSVRAASAVAGWPSDSWGSLESGRSLHPSPEKMHTAAGVLGIRPWIIHYIARTPDPLDRVALATKPTENWGRAGGALIRAARVAQDRGIAEARQSWATAWPALPFEAAQWQEMERSGALPAWPAPPVRGVAGPRGSLATTAGPWAWAILWAATGDPRVAAFLLPAFATVTGAVDLARVLRQFEEITTFHELAALARHCHASSDDFDATAFVQGALEQARRLEAATQSEEALTSPQRLAWVQHVWDRLSRAQQEQVLKLIDSLLDTGTAASGVTKGRDAPR